MYEMAPLRKTTRTYATHQIPLACDVYDASDYAVDSPAFLFFHSGGLVNGARICVPPWLVQTCFQRKWPLVSADYRLVPQAQGKELLQDALAAFEFARSLGGGPVKRKVVVGGASAGCFLACLIGHHANTKPLAILSITGIPTFRHPFFQSSVLLVPEPIKEEEVERYIAAPVSVGMNASRASFYMDSLLASGEKNPDWVPPLGKPEGFRGDDGRGMLYDYYLYENMFLPLVGEADPGFDWATQESGKEKLAKWPVTVLIQGDADVDVSPDVSASVAKALGPRAVFCEAKGQEHLFECASWIKDETSGMEAVRRAVKAVDKAVEDNSTSAM